MFLGQTTNTQQETFYTCRKASLLSQALAVLLIALTVFTASFRDAYFRYAIYFFPILWGVEGLVTGALLKKPDDKTRTYLFLMLAALIYPAIMGQEGGWALFVFMFLPYLALLIPVYVSFKAILFLFLLLAFGQVFMSVQSGFSFDALLEMNLAGHVLKQETHTIPFVLGLLLGPVLFKRHYVLFLFGLFCLFLGEKRIVLVGAAAGIACFFLSNHFFRHLLRDFKRRRNLLFFMLFGAMMLNIYMPDLLQYIADREGLNVNVFTSGRLAGQTMAYQHLFEGGLLSTLFGDGLGRADYWAGIAWGIPLIHNDYLRIVMDMGLVFGGLFLFCVTSLVASGRYALYLLPYMAVLWLTDNTTIYSFYSATVVLLILAQRAPIQPSSPVSEGDGSTQVA